MFLLALSILLLGAASVDVAPLVGAQHDYEYLANITVGGQTFSVIIDTGSSDTWLAQKGFACLNLTGHPVPAATCGFGSQGFDSKLSKSFQPYPSTSFYITYGDGEYLSGAAAFETVTVGGLTVTHQEIGMVASAAWTGDGINTGLLGLAYPSLTSVENTSHGQGMLYNPFFFNAVKQNKIPHPYFSIALNRGTITAEHSPRPDPHLGYLAFGGIAPVPVTNTTATLPVQGFSIATHAPVSGAGATYSYYGVDVQKYVFPGSAAIFTAQNSTILDSGTTLNLMPSAVAQKYNAAFNATWRDGQYYVDCAAKAPPFAVVLGGKTFTIDGRDQIVSFGKDADGKEMCISGTQDGGPDMQGSVFILGDVFLHNVVTTFDIQKNQVTVSQRQHY
ncbi:acid protease [Mycena rosella]|uniref:Acid protease n=1 Tax=Mycena rosella TaxID=1033263 RepID=A0AAD7FWH3_MYCRO|nr:acid protease [Mycena rosella]